jgi:uncharacterized protein YbaR (Trm112 family)
MIDPDLLKILCCPETHQSLKLADPALLQSVNQKITSGALHNRGGVKVEQTCEGGLIREDGKYLYPIRHEIPVMLVSEALPLTG